VKTLPLYIGIVFVVAAIAGGVSMVLQPPPPVDTLSSEPDEPTAEGIAEQKRLVARERQKQDDEEIRRILYEQVSQTQPDITEAWLERMCLYVQTEEDLEAYWKEILEKGRRYEAVYEEPNTRVTNVTPALKEVEVLSRIPHVYIHEARQFIHTQVPDADRLKHRVPNLLALAVYRAWSASVDDELSRKRGLKKSVAELLLAAGDPVISDASIVEAAEKEAVIPDEIKSSYLIEALNGLDLQAELAEAAGEDPGQFREERIRLHEVALVEGFSFVKRKTKEARERYSQSASSSAPDTVAIGRWNSMLNERLLSLGKIYIDAALAETTYRGRQQKYADLGFDVLAMVFQRSKTGAAITVLREANKIQRYNLWQMGRAAWRQAQLAVKSGKAEEADAQFFTAKQRYLQTLARLERSRQTAVLEEYSRLQAEISAWAVTKAETGEG